MFISLIVFRILCFLLLAYLGYRVYYNQNNPVVRRLVVEDIDFVVFYVSLFVPLIFDLLLLILNRKKNRLVYRLTLLTMYQIITGIIMSMLFAAVKVRIGANKSKMFSVPQNPDEWIPILVTLGVIFMITMVHIIITGKHKDEIKNVKTATMATPVDEVK